MINNLLKSPEAEGCRASLWHLFRVSHLESPGGQLLSSLLGVPVVPGGPRPGQSRNL